jgi:F0F1-type ATP synthase assembly protein I
VSRLTKALGAQRTTASADASSGNAGALGKGMDLALVTLVFLGLGALLDRWLGTKPLFMVVLVVLSLIGQFVRMWFDYDGAMRKLETERAARRLAPNPTRSTP